MCVIIVGGKHRPTLRELEAAGRQNPDGGGISWHEDNGVSFRKGLNAKQIHAAIRKLDKGTPFVAHFRFATVGEPSGALCHPFPVGKRTSLAESKGGVSRALFHNGTWSNWREVLAGMPGKHPSGEWSDSRAIAFLLGHVGEAMLDDIPCKFAVMHSAGVRVYPTSLEGWHTRNGVMYSNLIWTRRLPSRKPRKEACELFDCTGEQPTGLLNDRPKAKGKKAVRDAVADKKREAVPKKKRRSTKPRFAQLDPSWRDRSTDSQN